MRGQIQDFENKSENSEEMKNWSPKWKLKRKKQLEFIKFLDSFTDFSLTNKYISSVFKLLCVFKQMFSTSCSHSFFPLFVRI